MNVLVVYGSHLGSTAVIAEHVADVIRQDTGADTVVQPAELPASLDRYDAVIIGGGIYAGRWHPAAEAFVRRHAGALRRLPVWLFSSGPVGDAAASRRPVPPVAMEALMSLAEARGHVIFGGAHDRAEVEDSSLDRLEKFIARRFLPQGDWRDWDAINAWAHGMASEMRTGSAPVAAAG